MKKNFAALLALVLSACMLLCACGQQNVQDTSALEQQIKTLTQENAVLKEQVETLTRQLESIQSAVLTDWSLEARAASDFGSANIVFSAVPATQPEGQSVSLVVMLNGFEAESVQCAPAENGYHGTVTLPAADGYSYYCLITGTDGTQQQIPLVTPDNSDDTTLMNLASSLSGYGNLVVENWEYKANELKVTSGFFQAQMPLISADGAAVIAQTAELVLMHNGAEVERYQLFLTEGESAGTYESAISDISFNVPKLEDDHQLDLVLEITLSSGGSIVNNSCSWYYIDGGLNMVVG